MGRAGGGSGVADISCGLEQQRANSSYIPGDQKPEVRGQAPSQRNNQDQDSGSKLWSSQRPNTEPGDLLDQWSGSKPQSIQSSNTEPEGSPESEVGELAEAKPESIV